MKFSISNEYKLQVHIQKSVTIDIINDNNYKDVYGIMP